MTYIDGAAPPDSEIVKDGADASFIADVIEPSRQTPVIVDFWPHGAALQDAGTAAGEGRARRWRQGPAGENQYR
ncbi:MAG: hypothetical protein R3C25_00365 [Hyphomonadaceae bacterium]